MNYEGAKNLLAALGEKRYFLLNDREVNKKTGEIGECRKTELAAFTQELQISLAKAVIKNINSIEK